MPGWPALSRRRPVRRFHQGTGRCRSHHARLARQRHDWGGHVEAQAARGAGLAGEQRAAGGVEPALHRPARRMHDNDAGSARESMRTGVPSGPASDRASRKARLSGVPDFISASGRRPAGPTSRPKVLSLRHARSPGSTIRCKDVHDGVASARPSAASRTGSSLPMTNVFDLPEATRDLQARRPGLRPRDAGPARPALGRAAPFPGRGDAPGRRTRHGRRSMCARRAAAPASRGSTRRWCSRRWLRAARRSRPICRSTTWSPG